MKRIFLPIIIICIAGCAYAQNPPQVGHDWKATINVVDEAGPAIQAADVTIAYFVKPPPGESIAFAKKNGQTDANGIFTASEHSTSVELDISAQKTGYYTSGMTYELGHSFQYRSCKMESESYARAQESRAAHPHVCQKNHARHSLLKRTNQLRFCHG